MVDNKYSNLLGDGTNNHNPNGQSNERLENNKLSFERLFYMVWGYKWIILAIIIVCVGLAYWYTKAGPYL